MGKLEFEQCRAAPGPFPAARCRLVPGALEHGRRDLDRLLCAAVPGLVRLRPAGAGAAQRAEAPAERRAAGRRRLADRELWRPLRRFGAAGRSAALSAGGRARDRGPALLQPLGRRSARRRARALRQRPGRRHGAGRQHHHPAGRQEPVPDARAQPASQGPGDAAGAVAGTHLHQGPDPRALSQPGLFRRRHLRRRCGGEEVFRPLGARRHDLSGRHAGRPAQGAVALQSVQRPGPRQVARRAGHPQHGGGRPVDPSRGERDLRILRAVDVCRRPATRSASISPTG